MVALLIVMHLIYYLLQGMIFLYRRESGNYRPPSFLCCRLPNVYGLEQY